MFLCFQIGGLDQVILIDCDETTLQNALNARTGSGRLDDIPSAIPKRISNFKHNSLPILAYFDDLNKLSIVSGVFLNLIIVSVFISLYFKVHNLVLAIEKKFFCVCHNKL